MPLRVADQLKQESMLYFDALYVNVENLYVAPHTE